jgi:heme A synthase
MDTSLANASLVPRWLHYWAVLTVAATVALLGLGGVVTTFRVGMADPIWPTYPWHLLLISWEEPNPGFLIEHSHRLAGYLVGCCVIVQAIGLWFTARHRLLRWLGVVALAAVIAQGLLGGFRVRLNELFGTDLAAIHGVFAQIVFSLLVCVALLTSRKVAAPGIAIEDVRPFRGLALLLTGVILLQLVWGALVRHTLTALSQRLHILTAFAVVAALVWLIRAVREHPAARRYLGRAMTILAVFVVGQLALGVEAWLRRFGSGVLPEMQVTTVGQALVRTAHVLVGAWILATSVVISVLTFVPGLAADAAPAVKTQTQAPRFAAGITRQLEGTV